MKANSVLSCLAFTALVTARPLPNKPKILHREVPQEHSHEQFLTTIRASLNLDNPAGIGDPVFALLGNTAAAEGLGQIADVECLQQATADQAFTNAKAANDVPGMTAALIYRALERNTAKVGQASNLCTSIQATNAEIAAISQHQDPASEGAAEGNKAVVLELSRQISAIGGDPMEALKSGTFQPGDLNDASGKGNTCDTLDDPIGCIFSQGLLVEDATTDEIMAAVGGSGAEDSASPAADPAVQQEVAQPAVGDDQQSTCGSIQNDNSSTDDATADEQAAETGAQYEAPAEVGAQMGAPAEAEAQMEALSEKEAQMEAPMEAPAEAEPLPSLSGLDFGSCPNAGIVFGPGFDGRKEDSFQPADLTQLQHGSAQNIGIITTFICDRFRDNCEANEAAQMACESAKAATAGKTGQAAATAWNDALGLTDVPNLTGA